NIILEGEAQNDEYRDKVLPDRELVAACAGVIVIVSNNGTHPKKTVEEEVDGQKVRKEICTAYGTVGCRVHQQTWDDLYAELKEKEGSEFVLRCPQTVVYLPDGTISTRINTGSVPEVAEVIAAVQEAQKKAGPGLSEAQLVEVKKLLEEGRALLESK